MERYLLLWLLGIPIPSLVLIWAFGGLHLIEVGKRVLNSARPAWAIRYGRTILSGNIASLQP